MEARDLVSRLARVEHLEEHHRVHADHGVVLGDDFLPRNIEHLLHHVDLVTDAIDEGVDDVQAGIGGEVIFPEPFDGIDEALFHDAHAHHQEHDNDQDQQHQDKRTTKHNDPPLFARIVARVGLAASESGQSAAA